VRALVLAAPASLLARSSGGKTLLHAAALGGVADTVRALVDAGLEVDARDASGQTPLFCAAEKGHVDACRALLARGARADASDFGDNGVTPLRRAAACGHARVVELLVEAGADVNWASATKNTALHDAAWNGNEKTVRALLQLGAAVDARDKVRPGEPGRAKRAPEASAWWCERSEPPIRAKASEASVSEVARGN
jgi:ankyrin repeat protein